MPIFGKMTPEKWQIIGATMRDVGAGLGGGSGDALSSLEARRRKEMQAQQEQQALAELMGKMRPQDTRTPQINEMIGEANRVNSGRLQDVDRPRPMYAPMENLPTYKPGLDPSDPATMQALSKYASAGGNLQVPLAFSQMMQPDIPKLQSFGADEDIYQIDPSTGLPKILRPGTPKARPAPSGYNWGPDGNLVFIPGGPGDPRQAHTLAESRWRPRVGRAPAAAPAGGGGPWAKYSRGGK